MLLGAAARGAFPPTVVIAIKALACELPHEQGVPLSRFSMSELKREAVARGIVAEIGEKTILRWLSEDAIKPWNHRSWIFPPDPDFEVKAGRIPDLHEGLWARVFGRCESSTGIEPFNRLVQQVMSREPYCSAQRVFWVVDNGSSHRGQASIDRLQGRWHNLVLVHTPVHASWLNQVEIYFSVVQRKVLTPNDFASTD